MRLINYYTNNCIDWIIVPTTHYYLSIRQTRLFELSVWLVVSKCNGASLPVGCDYNARGSDRQSEGVRTGPRFITYRQEGDLALKGQMLSQVTQS